MKYFRSFDKYLSRIEEAIISYSIWIILISVVLNIFSRSIFNYSLTFTEELGQFLVIIITFIGIGYGVRVKRHISMSALYDLLPDRYRRLLLILISFVTAGTFFYLAYFGIEYVAELKAYGRVSPVLQVPIYAVLTAVPLGLFLGGLQYVKVFLELLIYGEDSRRNTEIEELKGSDDPKEGN